MERKNHKAVEKHLQSFCTYGETPKWEYKGYAIDGTGLNTGKYARGWSAYHQVYIFSISIRPVVDGQMQPYYEDVSLYTKNAEDIENKIKEIINYITK